MKKITKRTSNIKRSTSNDEVDSRIRGDGRGSRTNLKSQINAGLRCAQQKCKGRKVKRGRRVEIATACEASLAMTEGRCEDCEHSVPAGSLKALTLICNHKAGAEVPWQVVGADEGCANFERVRELVPPDISAALAEGAKLLPLSQNKFAIVDADDYERLNNYKWCLSKTRHTNYAMRRTKGKRVNGKRVKRKTIMMHRFIMNAPRGLVVDHINHNGLDNRKANLRLCTRAENSRNRRPFNIKGSRYKGVSWDKGRKVFIACIYCKGKNYYLGRFKSEVAAAKAYDRKAVELFREYAYLNFPEDR